VRPSLIKADVIFFDCILTGVLRAKNQMCR